MICTIILTGVSLLCMRPLLKLMNTPDNIFDDAYSYIMIISGGLVTTVFYNLFSSYLRAVGNSQIPLVFLVFSAVLNVILDLVFIATFHMGVSGAGYATILSQGISAVLCLIYIYLRMPALRPEKSHWKLRAKESRQQMTMGIPMALQFAITASGTMIMQAAINIFGSDAVAALYCCQRAAEPCHAGNDRHGTEDGHPQRGSNFGKGDLARIRKGVRASLSASAVYAVAVALLVWILLKPCLGLFFTADVDLSVMMPWAETYIHICAIFYIPLSTIFVFRNTMQGCGYGFLPMMGGVSELAARMIVAFMAMSTVELPTGMLLRSGRLDRGRALHRHLLYFCLQRYRKKACPRILREQAFSLKRPPAACAAPEYSPVLQYAFYPARNYFTTKFRILFGT